MHIANRGVFAGSVTVTFMIFAPGLTRAEEGIPTCEQRLEPGEYLYRAFTGERGANDKKIKERKCEKRVHTGARKAQARRKRKNER